MTDTGATGATGATSAASASPDPLATAQAAYLAALDAAATPDPEAAKMRATARELMAAADKKDGPARVAARQTKQQFMQFHQRNGARPAQRPAPAAPIKPAATGGAKS